MDELQKTEARNYLMAGGLFLFALIPLLGLLGLHQTSIETMGMATFIGGIMLLVIGIILLTLHKRDLAGITFIIFGIINAFAGYGELLFGIDGLLIYMISAIITVIWGIILLFSKDKQKWIFAPLNIIFALSFLIEMAIVSTFPIDTGVVNVIHIICDIIIILISIYFSFAAAFERISLPGRNLITADETTDFKQSGSAVGYIIFAGIGINYALTYLNVFPTSEMNIADFVVDLGFSTALIIIGILLFAVGKMRFTPVMFIMMGIAEMLSFCTFGTMYYGIGVAFIITGIFAIMRKESRILPGLMLIINGASFFISAGITGTAISPIASVILNGIPAVIAIYLAFATLSQRKVPLF